MPRDTTHADYAAYRKKWDRIRRVIDGEDALKDYDLAHYGKEGARLYLPMPTGMPEPTYLSFVERAAFTGYTARIRDGLNGLIWRKSAAAKVPSAMKGILEDATRTGVPLDEFVKGLTEEVVTVTRAGILVDYPVVNEALTMYDVSARQLRPYFTMYSAEQILDWREGMYNGAKVLTYVKLEETYQEPSKDDPWITVRVRTIRELSLKQVNTERGPRVACLQTVAKMNIGKVAAFDFHTNIDLPLNEWVETMKDAPLIMSDDFIDFIPFIPISSVDTSIKLRKPLLLDVMTLNVHHYQASADRNWATHWSDVPTPVLIGTVMTPDGAPSNTVQLGATSAINLQMGGDAKFLEFSGQGLNPTKELMSEYVQAMVSLGSRIIATDTRGTEAAETAVVHRAGEHSVLASIANSVGAAITKGLKIAAKWMGLSDSAMSDIAYKLNTDFFPASMTSQDIIAVVGAWAAGALSDRAMYDAFMSGELLTPDKTFEQFIAEIKDSKLEKIKTTADAGGNFGQQKTNAGDPNAKEGGVNDKNAQERAGSV